MLEKFLDIFKSLGLPGLFAGMYLESFGIPFPGTLLVAFAGFLAKQGHFNIFFAGFVAIFGYLLGSTTAFLIGRHVGEPFFRRWGKYLHLTSERFDTAQKWYQRSAPGFIIGGRFIPTVGNVTPYMAGISNISLLKFLFYDLIHAVLWLSFFLWVGGVLGKNWHLVVENQWTRWIWIIGIVIIVFFLMRYLYGGKRGAKLRNN